MHGVRSSAARPVAWLALTALVLTGCSRNAPTSSVTALAAATGSATLGAAYDAVGRDLQVADSTRLGPCGALALPAGIPGGCPYDAATAWFTCGADAGPDGFTHVRAYRFLDASGAAEAAYDSLLTAAIEIHSEVSGVATHDGTTTSLASERHVTMGGLAGVESARTLNGGGTSYRRDSSATAVRWARSTTAVDQVLVPAPFRFESWPLSGTLMTTFETSDGLSRTGVITFNGTRYVTLVVGSESRVVDLAHGGGPRPPGGGPGPGPGGPGGGRH